jgi:hypothetical protein
MTDYDETTPQARLMFNRICESVRNSSRLTQSDKGLFEIVAQDFERSLEQILNINDEGTRLAAEHAVSLALSVGYFHQGNPTLVEQTKDEARTEARNDQTKSANASTRNEEIRKIITHYKQAMENRWPETALTNGEIISYIWRDVFIEVNKLGDVPEKWRLDPNNNREDAARIKENIRGFLRRMK